MVIKTPCPDTPENRKALLDEMLRYATAVRDSKREGGKSLEVYPYLLVAHNGTLHHISAAECIGSVFVIAEYARGAVTLIEKKHCEVRWTLPPVEPGRYRHV